MRVRRALPWQSGALPDKHTNYPNDSRMPPPWHRDGRAILIPNGFTSRRVFSSQITRERSAATINDRQGDL
jgi:hypothetical protein